MNLITYNKFSNKFNYKKINNKLLNKKKLNNINKMNDDDIDNILKSIEDDNTYKPKEGFNRSK